MPSEAKPARGDDPPRHHLVTEAMLQSLTLLTGHVVDVLPTLDPVHMVATSPPYYGLRDYGLEPTAWPAVSYAPMAGLPDITVPPMTCCLGLEPTLEAYVGHIVYVWRLLWPVLRDDGTCWLNLGDSYSGNASTGGEGKETKYTGQSPLPSKGGGLKPKDLCMVPHRVAFALQADGWYVRSAIVWAKGVSFCETYAGSCMPEPVRDRPTSSYEMVFLLAKQDRYYYDAEAVKEEMAHDPHTTSRKSLHSRPDGGKRMYFDGDSSRVWAANGKRNLRAVWTINPQPFPGAHYAVWPPALVAPMIKAGTSQHGTCAACGAPWGRVVERQKHPTRDMEAQRQEAAASPGRSDGAIPGPSGMVDTTQTTGWQPTCTCEADTVPAVVLDPFAGSATTCVTARSLGRHSIGIDRQFDDAVLDARSLRQMHLGI